MLQQRRAPAVAELPQLEARVYGDTSSEASSDAAEDPELPQCKIKRNYNCARCTFYTQNPRAYLVHIRDVHFERFKIHDCPHCVYASRHHQKLVRHLKMVHEANNGAAEPRNKREEEPPASTASDTIENIEDMLEEVEYTSSVQDEEMSYQDDIDDMDEASNISEPSVESAMQVDKSFLFSCSKCNYVTHLKSRYTKHVKYHSMPMTKCNLCEFRTPYKWNLDRHMKNHGAAGRLFSCSMCNFTADIKQSLTVHEMNHHSPAAGQSHASRRRNRVGASDVLTDEAAGSLESKEEEGSGDSRSSHSVPDSYIPDIGDMLSGNDSNDMSPKAFDDQKDSNQSEGKGPNRKKARPIPSLIPLNASAPSKSTSEPPVKKMRESINTPTMEIDSNDTPTDMSLTAASSVPSKQENAPKKKNESFFDKLKERILTESGKEGSLTCKDCGFESKCLSEHSVHEKNCIAQSNRLSANAAHSSMGSTRCQHCRHRCKSSADLYVHMKTCTADNKTESKDLNNGKIINAEQDIEPHPMENRVFVWNDIGQESSKFDNPLDINIQEDATLPKSEIRHYDPNNVDALHDNEGMNLSPTQAVGKKVYKCPHCPFWASTASRFHVHIVGHLNKKPFECSLCQYKSNWRWDITKHIKLKSARDSIHNDAKVLMTDETGRRNYSKYNKFLAILKLNENGVNEFHYIDSDTPNVDATIELDESGDTYSDNGLPMHMQPLNLQKYSKENTPDSFEDNKPKKTLWKCKKCNYKDSSKEALLEHVREHGRHLDMNPENLKNNSKKIDTSKEPDLAYRCGHCNQLSNWKHVIQRHCRLKHDGVIKVIATEKPKPDLTHITLSDLNLDYCPKCPFTTGDKMTLNAHLQNHMPSAQSVYKCYFCYYFAKNDQELVQHLAVHGVTDMEGYDAKGGRAPTPEQSGTSKRHKCSECPYETNSRSQYMYHEQFHRLRADTPYKCQECNYSVSKRHLLHQHMKVHGILTTKKENDLDEYSPSNYKNDDVFVDDISYVWVAAKNEFHKMYKCRYCSYVNTLKSKIPTHEEVHVYFMENSEMVIYKCLDCKYTCQSAPRLAEHSKTHNEIYGRIYFNVETDVPDEEQIEKLREIIEEENKFEAEASQNNDSQNPLINGDEDKILFFCQKCPARFLAVNELKAHERFHDLVFSSKCLSCEFSVPQEQQLVTHANVHTHEYQVKTKTLKTSHDTHPDHKQPTLELIRCAKTLDNKWVVAQKTKKPAAEHNPRKHHDKQPKQYYCKQCPAKFFKNSALSYHRSLHGGEGDHRCKKCDYTVKNIGNLAKHEMLHDDEKSNCDYDSGDDIDFKNVPLSGTDLFQRKTEAQKRVLVDKDKLVKPNDHFPPVLQADPQFGYLIHGNPEFIYPTYMKNGRQKEKRYKCHKCPSAFEKREQYKIHLSLHGSKQRYKCEICDYSVKYYANYVQHMRKHQMNDEALAERKKDGTEIAETPAPAANQEVFSDNKGMAIKTMPRSVVKSDFQQFSFSDQQTLRLLQRRRSINSAVNESTTPETPLTKERKLHMCVLCPYSNQRQDALSNHYKRHEHKEIVNQGIHSCSHCDLTVVQSHFLRDHMKLHFNVLRPQCFTANEDVKFNINKIDEEDASVAIAMDTIVEPYKPAEERIYVQVTTGEITVEQ